MEFNECRFMKMINHQFGSASYWALFKDRVYHQSSNGLREHDDGLVELRVLLMVAVMMRVYVYFRSTNVFAS